MKLKQKPDDFIVSEINAFDVSSAEGKYRLYILEKRSVETFSLLKYLSKANKIPLQEFGIAGLKDKHALSRQYLTIPSKYKLQTLQEPNFTITFAGYVKDKINIGNMEGNRFEITVRDLGPDAAKEVQANAESIVQYGVPNYFDSQRFGSVAGDDFIAKHVVKKDYEGAVKIYLTSCTKRENRQAREEKNMLLRNWSTLLDIKIKNRSLSIIISGYRKRKSWLDAYKKIPSHLREMFVFAYQSYLWNECLKQAFRQNISSKNLYGIRYSLGELLFYHKLTGAETGIIPGTFRLIGPDVQFSMFEKEIVDSVLAKEGLSLPDFDIRSETGNFFKGYERKAILRPDGFSISGFGVDELNKNRQKATVCFTLPKGSYATIVTKKLFGK